MGHEPWGGMLSAWEYRYTTGRGRYLLRAADEQTPLHDVAWSDYLPTAGGPGESIYADYTVDPGTGMADVTRRYMPDLWETDLTPLQGNPPGEPQTTFVHSDLLVRPGC